MISEGENRRDDGAGQLFLKRFLVSSLALNPQQYSKSRNHDHTNATHPQRHLVPGNRKGEMGEESEQMDECSNGKEQSGNSREWLLLTIVCLSVRLSGSG